MILLSLLNLFNNACITFDNEFHRRDSQFDFPQSKGITRFVVHFWILLAFAPKELLALDAIKNGPFISIAKADPVQAALRSIRDRSSRKSRGVWRLLMHESGCVPTPSNPLMRVRFQTHSIKTTANINFRLAIYCNFHIILYCSIFTFRPKNIHRNKIIVIIFGHITISPLINAGLIWWRFWVELSITCLISFVTYIRQEMKLTSFTFYNFIVVKSWHAYI